ncbi:hypothetical protein C0T31_11845 [Dysgonamonadaceae bacterium]|jgi:hypothetical protein|nr:hypothetical protein C0T31_11845 [Dysgonamonadaceae bacterium]
MSKKKEELTGPQKKELKKILRLNPNFSAQGKLGEFFDSYLLCEATARKLIYYKTGKDHITLYTKSIDSALKRFFPNNFDSIPVNKIFDSSLKTNRNNKTCRQLRNAYIHNLSKKDRTEIENRITPLKEDMQKWLSLFEAL